jgi:SAM-dependent methyltransferase
MSDAHSQGPAGLMQMMQGAQATALLATGIQLGVFEKLDGGALDAKRAAERIHCPERSTHVLLDALSALGLLQKRGDTYALSPVASDFLVPSKPTYLGGMANIFAGPMMWSANARLADAVRGGGTILPEHAETPNHPFWETFAQSTSGIAFPSAMVLDSLVGEFVASKPKARVLDVAAGSGIYGYTLAKHPNVQLTTLDWPKVLVHTREWAKRMNVDASRVRYIEGNLFDVDWSGTYDVVLLSHVYHHFDAKTCESLTRKAAEHVAPGGRLVIQDFLYDAELRNPMGALFAVTMLIWTRAGQTYSVDDYSGWLTRAGLGAPTVHPSQGMPATFLVATKK